MLKQSQELEITHLPIAELRPDPANRTTIPFTSRGCLR